MIGYYVGMALMTVISVMCLREAHSMANSQHLR